MKTMALSVPSMIDPRPPNLESLPSPPIQKTTDTRVCHTSINSNIIHFNRQLAIWLPQLDINCLPHTPLVEETALGGCDGNL